MRQLRTGVGLGNVLERFAFLNLGDAPCLLQGFPRVTGVTARGVRRSVPARRSPDGTYFGTLVPADIGPGERGLLDFATGEGCEDPSGSAKRYRALIFVLPAPEPTGPRSKLGTPDTLTVNLVMPAETRAGTTLRFVVTLANPTAVAVRLTPCPRYNEGIYTVSGRVSRWYWLNCEAARSISPHGQARCAMALPIPAGVPAGLAKFW